MAGSTTESPTAPFGVRLGLMALLPLVALAIYLDGQRFDPDLVELGPLQPATGPAAVRLPDRIAGLQRAGQVRRFGEDTLYEYINGHAEFFIGAGFRGLTVHEYGVAGDGQPALVVNLYDMGAPLNAFGVLVDEAGDREPVDIGTMGFRGGQGLSFIEGPYYVQVSQFDPALPLESAAADLALGLAGQVEESGLAFRFPDLGKVTATRFVKEDYRGLEFLNRVLERGFEGGETEITAFLVRASSAEIGELVAAFEGFFEQDQMPYERVDRQGLSLFLVDDPYEGPWFFAPLREVLIGVYAPLDGPLLEAIAAFASDLGGAPTAEPDGDASRDIRRPEAPGSGR